MLHVLSLYEVLVYNYKKLYERFTVYNLYINYMYISYYMRSFTFITTAVAYETYRRGKSVVRGKNAAYDGE